MKFPAALLLCTLLIAGCKTKKKEEQKSFFPVLSFLKSQVADVDTSVYSIIKIITIGGKSDTSYIRREQFRQEASDFLSIPDISSNQLQDDYTETKLYNSELNQVSLSYLPNEESEDEISRQEVLIKPDNNGDKVSSIFIDRTINAKDSSIQKILFWQVDKRFKITTLVQKQDKPERKEIVELVWGNNPSAQ